MIYGRVEDALVTSPLSDLKGKINLIVTSPPFPLVRKKRYGNETGEAYLNWLEGLANPLADLHTEDGSIVIEISNAWEAGAPAMSTLPPEALLAFKRAAKLHLCQHVICHNPSRLPSPAAWVNLKRARLKDSFTHVWSMSKVEFPKADNRQVFNPYSKDMKKLLSRQATETGFLKDHGGSIGPNVLDLTEEQYPNAILRYTGTKWDPVYRIYCKDRGLPTYSARVQSSLSAFFIQFLTDENDLVPGPFGGSNTTGSNAESHNRRWVAIDADRSYVDGSLGRFPDFAHCSSLDLTHK